MSAKPDWAKDGRDWPNRDASRFVQASGLTWHVQVAGAGPVLLLLHGTGAATHSWRDVLPQLAGAFTVVAPDLPGHGFTDLPSARRMSLPEMARAVRELLDALALEPALVVGHSAGAAVAIRASLDGIMAPASLVGINAALVPFPGVAAQIFPSLARLLVANPFVPAVAAWAATDRTRVKRLIEGTGSRIDARGLDFYARLFASRRHADAALRMMANWDLATLFSDLPALRTPLTLLIGSHDRAVPPVDAEKVQAVLPATQVERFPGGHLLHEETPKIVSDAIWRVAERAGVLRHER